MSDTTDKVAQLVFARTAPLSGLLSGERRRIAFAGLAAGPQLKITVRRGTESDFAAADLIRSNDEFWMTPFQNAAWRVAWNRTLGLAGGIQPVTAIISDGARTAAILPLAIRRSGGLGVLTWHANDQGDYGAPIMRVEQLGLSPKIDGKAIMRQIGKEIGGIDLIYLPKQPRMIGAEKNPFIFPGSMRHHAGAHAMNFVEGESFDSFMTRRRSSATRRQLRKKQRALEALGKVEFGFIKDRQAARRMVRLCLDWKSAQLAQLGHWDPFQRPDIRDFIIDHFSTAAGQDTWVACLTLDGVPLAAAFGFASRREWLLYQMSMDGDRGAQCSPGTQLLLNLISSCIEAGVGRLDLSLGDETYKFEWCDEHSDLLISTMPLTIKGLAVHAAIKARAAAQKWLASNERLYDMAKSLKRRLADGRMPA